MSKFKVGQRVRRVCGTHKGMLIGDEDVIVCVVPPHTLNSVPGLYLKKWGHGHDPASFELVTEDKSKFHKHHDLILAWAKGAKIQWKSNVSGVWYDVDTPPWTPDREYRIKPEPRPDYTLSALECGSVTLESIRVTFDGETKKPKAVELIP